MSWNRVVAALIAVQALLICAYSVWVLGIGLSRSEQFWTIVAIAAVAGIGAWGALAAWSGRSNGALTAQVPLTAIMAFGTASYFAESVDKVGFLFTSLVLVLALLRVGVHRPVVASLPAIVLSVAAIVAVTVPPIGPSTSEKECAAPAVELFTELQHDFSNGQVVSREAAFAALCQPFARERYWFAIMASMGAGAAVEIGRRRVGDAVE